MVAQTIASVTTASTTSGVGPAANLLGRASERLDSKDWEGAAALAQEALLLEPENTELQVLVKQIEFLGLNSQLEALREEYQACKDECSSTSLAETENRCPQIPAVVPAPAIPEKRCDLQNARDERSQLEMEVAELKKLQQNMVDVRRMAVPKPSLPKPSSAEAAVEGHRSVPSAVPAGANFLSDESAILACGHDSCCAGWVGLHGATDGSLGCPGAAICGVPGKGNAERALILRTLVLCDGPLAGGDTSVDVILDAASLVLNDGSHLEVHQASELEGMYRTAVIERNGERLLSWPSLAAANHLRSGDWITVQHAFCIPEAQFECESLALLRGVSIVYRSSDDNVEHTFECSFDATKIAASYDGRVLLLNGQQKAQLSGITVLESGEVVSSQH